MTPNDVIALLKQKGWQQVEIAIGERYYRVRASGFYPPPHLQNTPHSEISPEEGVIYSSHAEGRNKETLELALEDFKQNWKRQADKHNHLFQLMQARKE